MRFTPFSYSDRYGMRLQRLTLDGGFACPNRDGTLGTEGCTFCDNAAFHPGYTRGKSILERLGPEIAIGRIASSVPPAFTDAPWGLLKHEELLRRLVARLEERNTRQGSRLN